jgi:hypothetical protein
MIGADSEMQCIAGAQPQCVLVDEAGGVAELQLQHRDHC